MAKIVNGHTPVDATIHNDTRANIPTADAAPVFFDEAGDRLAPIVYSRDTSLDPQLVWKGKDAQDLENLLVDAPPIYIQEKVDPRVLVENLRESVKRGEPQPEPSLFDDFDGLDGLEAVEYYQHDAKWSNRMILGDSLQVMGSLAEREQLRGKVQMIYMDPPYGIKFGSNWQVSARKRDVKDGNLSDAAREAEQIKAFRDTWELGIHSYLAYLRDRLVVAKDLLTESGSVFVQIGDANVHVVRSLLDEVFGADCFISQIVFRTSVGLGSDGLDNVASYILWYGRSDTTKYRNLYRRTSPGEAGASRYKRVVDPEGKVRPATAEELANPTALPVGAHLFRDQGLTSRTGSATTGFPYTLEGHTYRPTSGGWRTNSEGMRRLELANRLMRTGNTLSYVKYWDDFSAVSLPNVWEDVSGGITSRTDPKIYVVQTPTRVIERCVLMATDPGDLVIDPTCGAGTTALVSEQWGRRWITVDTSRVALALARQRLMGASYPYYLLAENDSLAIDDSAGIPSDGSVVAARDVKRGFQYEQIKRITLKSIARNPDIHEGMTRSQVEQAISRHAEFEYLRDRPVEDPRKVRVTGPFTVESLSPHRSLASPVSAASMEPRAVRGTTLDHEQPSFEQSIIANLHRAGVQNGRKSEKLRFEQIEDYAGRYVQAIADRVVGDSDPSGAPGRIAIAIGPQYGTVSPQFIKRAAREAIADERVDLLCVLGFAFDPQAASITEADGVTVQSADEFANVAGERRLGRIKVLLVRMNADLLMGEDLKKTGAGNLFTVFGEPDIAIRNTVDGSFELEILGVDVFDPTTGEVRTADTGQIALWMIDTNYNEESFFVRHCYFTGGADPYKRLKATLKADIDEDAWAQLYRTISIPFEKPETGKIAVKVINDYGDEVMKVVEIQ